MTCTQSASHRVQVYEDDKLRKGTAGMVEYTKSW